MRVRKGALRIPTLLVVCVVAVASAYYIALVRTGGQKPVAALPERRSIKWVDFQEFDEHHSSRPLTIIVVYANWTVTSSEWFIKRLFKHEEVIEFVNAHSVLCVEADYTRAHAEMKRRLLDILSANMVAVPMIVLLCPDDEPVDVLVGGMMTNREFMDALNAWRDRCMGSSLDNVDREHPDTVRSTGDGLRQDNRRDALTRERHGVYDDDMFRDGDYCHLVQEFQVYRDDDEMANNTLLPRIQGLLLDAIDSGRTTSVRAMPENSAAWSEIDGARARRLVAVLNRFEVDREPPPPGLTPSLRFPGPFEIHFMTNDGGRKRIGFVIDTNIDNDAVILDGLFCFTDDRTAIRAVSNLKAHVNDVLSWNPFIESDDN